MKHKFTFTSTIVLLLFFLTSTMVGQEQVTNGDFATDPFGVGSETWFTNGSYGATWDGANFDMDLTAGDLEGTDGYLYQELNSGNALTANTVYDVAIGANDDNLQVGIYLSGTLVYSNEFPSGVVSFDFTATTAGVYQIRLAGGVGATPTIDVVSVDENVAPTCTPVPALTGATVEAGYDLGVTENFADADTPADLVDTYTYQWYRANTSAGTSGDEAIAGATASTYTLATADIAKYVFVKVVPYALTGTSPGVATMSDVLGPVASNVAPAVTAGPTINVTTLKQGSTIDVTYTVADNETDNVTSSTYQLYRSSDSAGVNKIALTGPGADSTGAIFVTATSDDYTLTYADVGKYIILEVTPNAATGVTPGTVVTTHVGPVTGFALGIPDVTNANADPDDGATLVSVTPSYFWAVTTDGGLDAPDGYELEVSTDAQFGNIVDNYIGADLTYPNATFTTVADLAPATKYYWRVKATLSTTSPASSSPWSQIKTFTTTPIDAAPTQTHPLGGNLVYTNTPTLYWYTGAISDDQYFEVCYGPSGTTAPTVDATPTYTETFIDYTVIGTDLYYELTTPLISNTVYEWYVRATDNDGTGGNYSSWTSAGEFKTAASNGGPVEPIGTYPTAGELQYSNSPYLYWYVVTQTTGLYYEVYVSESNTPNPPTASSGDEGYYDYDDVGTSAYHQVSGLASSSTYYWWVRSTEAGGANPSDWSDRYSFTTTEASGSPVKPILSYPANGELVYQDNTTLSWYAITIASDLKYDLYYSTTNTAPTSGTTPSQSGITRTNTTVSSLTASETYYWWVRSTDVNGLNPSDWSDVGSFEVSSIVGVINTPVAIYPIGGTVPGTSVDLSWGYYGTGTGITYQLQYSLYPTMTPLATTPAINIVDPSATTYTLSGLATGTTYYWQVMATDNNGTPSSWSTVASFSTATTSAAPLVVPMVGSPIANVVIDTDSPELSWFLPTQSDGLSYELQYSVNGEFTDAVSINDIPNTTVTLSNLKNGTSYAWRVRSKTTDGSVSIYSAIGSFIGQGVTDVAEPGIIPEKFEVSQNYPNPFNPSTVIKYSLPEASFVSLRVYNMLGQEIATLLNEEVDAGVYNITWNGINNSGVKVATGTYIYRVVAGNNVTSKKMILLK